MRRWQEEGGGGRGGEEEREGMFVSKSQNNKTT